MVRTFLALLLLLPNAVLAQGWSQISVGGTTEDILQIAPGGGFSDRFLVGANGLIARSDHTRVNWNIEVSSTTADLYGCQRHTSSQVWASGDNGVVRVWNGTTWLVRNVPNANARFRNYSRSSGVSNAVGSDGTLYNSQNFGVDWSPFSSGVSTGLNHGAGFTHSTNWIVGDAGVILRTTDGGANWSQMVSGTTENLHHIIEAAQPWLVVVGDNGTVLRSSDAGVTWTQSVTGTNADLYHVGSSGQSGFFLLAVGQQGTVLKSADTGVTWCQLNPDTNVDLYASSMVTNLEYIVAGAGGVMMRTTDGGGDCTQVTSAPEFELNDTRFSLRGPSPHPVASVATVVLEVARDQHLTAELFDVRGRRVDVVFEGRVEHNEPITWALRTSQLAAGVYFLHVQGETFEARRKVTVLR